MRSEDIQEILDILQANLAKLSRQKALFGSSLVPLHILNEIEETAREIGRYDAVRRGEQIHPTVASRVPTAGTGASRHLFTSYSRQDAAIANSVCVYMESRGVTCWIAPRDVNPGADFDEVILDAIDASVGVLLILSRRSNMSRFVQSELNRAFAKGKRIFTLRIEDVAPSRQLELYLARQQWLDAFPPPMEERLDRLVAAVLSQR